VFYSFDFQTNAHNVTRIPIFLCRFKIISTLDGQSVFDLNFGLMWHNGLCMITLRVSAPNLANKSQIESPR
jgi:hypothetical protein